MGYAELPGKCGSLFSSPVKEYVEDPPLTKWENPLTFEVVLRYHTIIATLTIYLDLGPAESWACLHDRLFIVKRRGQVHSTPAFSIFNYIFWNTEIALYCDIGLCKFDFPLTYELW